MPAKDMIHDAVKNALIKDGWTITHDPYTIKYEEVTAYADLGAEITQTAEKENHNIAVEINSFISPSPLYDLKIALGQYDIDKVFLKATAPERQLYVAVSHKVYDEIFQQKAYQLVIKEYKIPLLIVNVDTEEIVEWNCRMDKTTQYRNLIKSLLTRHANIVGSQCTPEMETILSFDEEHDQYLWLQVGWQKDHRVHGVTLHLRLHNDKVWIEQDWTENGIATELLNAGLCHDDIVLGFRNPSRRPLTGFAVA